MRCNLVAYQKKAIEMMEAILACPLAQDQPDDPQRKQHLIDAQDNKGETGILLLLFHRML